MNKMREALLNIATVVVALGTIALIGIAIYRQFASPPDPRTVVGRQPPKMLEDWRQIAEVGHRTGPEEAEVTVVVFSDFECPMCAAFATRTYPDFEARHPGRIRLVYRHWPLSKHRFSYPAARASECAAAQGRFREFHDAIYAGQRQLGLKTFIEFASEAEVPDLESFDACRSSEEPVAAIEADILEVERIGGTGTPTVIVNGWLLLGGVGPQLLDSISQQFLAPQTAGRRN